MQPQRILFQLRSPGGTCCVGCTSDATQMKCIVGRFESYRNVSATYLQCGRLRWTFFAAGFRPSFAKIAAIARCSESASNLREQRVKLSTPFSHAVMGVHL